MTNERIEELTIALTNDKESIADLFAMEPAEAAAKLTERGYDFTAEELVEYGKVLDTVKSDMNAQEGELLESSLDDVSGGGLGCVFLLGVCVGYWVYTRKW